MFKREEASSHNSSKATDVLKAYVKQYYPSLSNWITEPQYEQLAWTDYNRCSHQALLAPESMTMASFPFRQKE